MNEIQYSIIIVQKNVMRAVGRGESKKAGFEERSVLFDCNHRDKPVTSRPDRRFQSRKSSVSLSKNSDQLVNRRKPTLQLTLFIRQPPFREIFQRLFILSIFLIDQSISELLPPIPDTSSRNINFVQCPGHIDSILIL
jgi:hypothetical protein